MRISDWSSDVCSSDLFIHVDPEKAKLTPFGGTIAHGFLTLSLFPMLMAKSDCPRPAAVKMGVNYGGNKVRFLSPVRSGKRRSAERRVGQACVRTFRSRWSPSH